MTTSLKLRRFWAAAPRRLAFGLVPLLVLPLCCLAQQNKVVLGPVDPVSVKRGATITQTLKPVVLAGFHVNSDKPKDEFLIPLKLTWNAGPLEAKSVSYPKAEEIKVGSQMLVVFTGALPIQTEFKVPANAPAGAATMTGKLRYQACNSEMCFRPSTLDVRVPVNIE